jgi:DNA-binding transcriptional regulator YiaG
MAGATLDQALDEARSRKGLPAPCVRRMLRELSGMSQADVALVVGVSDATISRWESGLRHPRRPALARYAAVLERLAQEVNA